MAHTLQDTYADAYLDTARAAVADLPQSLIEDIGRRYRSIDATRRGIAPDYSDIGTEDAARALVHFSHGKDSCHAVARSTNRAIRADDAPAVQYADRREVRGALCKNRAKASSFVTRTQSKVRASVNSFVALADSCKKYATLRAACVDGGSIWRRCKNRAARRYLRAAVHKADTLARDGDWHGACKVLRGV